MPKLKEVDLNKARLEREIDNLPVDTRFRERKIHDMTLRLDALYSDKYYEQKYSDMQTRMDSLYDEIAEVKAALESVQMQISGIREQKISQQRVLEFLELFDIMYEEFTEAEKKEFFNSFIKRIDIYPQPLENGQILKSIQFRFPVYYQGNEVDMFFPNGENTVETVCLLTREK